MALIAFAYGTPEDPLERARISGVPPWVGSERFDVAAKAPEGSPDDRLRLMVRALLADRFKLITHRETREGDVYALVLARRDGRLGPKMTRSSVDCASARKEADARIESPLCDTKRTVLLQSELTVIYTGRGVPLESLVSIVKREAGRPVIDRTGLMGPFDFDLQFSMDSEALRRAYRTGLGQTPPSTQDGLLAAPVPEGERPIFRALQTQLGLKLEPRRGPVEYLVIDKAERPGPN